MRLLSTAIEILSGLKIQALSRHRNVWPVPKFTRLKNDLTQNLPGSKPTWPRTELTQNWPGPKLTCPQTDLAQNWIDPKLTWLKPTRTKGDLSHASTLYRHQTIFSGEKVWLSGAYGRLDLSRNCPDSKMTQYKTDLSQNWPDPKLSCPIFAMKILVFLRYRNVWNMPKSDLPQNWPNPNLSCPIFAMKKWLSSATGMFGIWWFLKLIVWSFIGFLVPLRLKYFKQFALICQTWTFRSELKRIQKRKKSSALEMKSLSYQQVVQED